MLSSSPITFDYLKSEIAPVVATPLALIEKAQKLSERMLQEMSVEEVLKLERTVQAHTPGPPSVAFLRTLVSHVKKQRPIPSELEVREGEEVVLCPEEIKIEVAEIPEECKVS